MPSETRSAPFPFALTLLFISCIALAGLAAAALVVATLELTRSTRDVEHTLRVQQALETLQLTLVNAETGQRGFLLTGQPHFLEPYIEAVAKQAYYLGTLERLTVDDPQQRQSLDGLKPLVEERLHQLAETMTAARGENALEATREHLNRGRELMQQVRLALQGMRETEDRRLTERQAEVERRGRYGALFMLLSNGASLLGLTVLYVAMRGYHRRRQDMEAAVRTSEHEYRDLFENASAGQAECELNSGRFVRTNHKLSEMLGHSTEELRRQTLVDLLPRGNRLDNARAYRELVEGTRESVTFEQPLRRKDNSTFLAAMHLTLTRSSAGEPLRAIMVVEDIAERTRTSQT
ncbi:MAG: CHASE3 domain-containing protein, partial [Pseudomonadota bacterium]|nr:CHASE3 domain-containing protein [Pseudomonadota bacterium]